MATPLWVLHFFTILTVFSDWSTVPVANVHADPASDQLINWSQTQNERQSPARSFLGSPLVSLTASVTTDPLNGPILLEDTNFMNIISAFDRERIPERVVHAKGGGAHGTFRVTHDITRYTKPAVFAHVGQKTDVFVRFSTVGGEIGTADTVQDPRGFAVKFYTRDGNWDLVGNNMPVFSVRDPILFPSFVHSRKRNPQTHLPDANMFWDFVSLRPESTHHTMFIMSDLGFPNGFRFMNGFGVHTFKLVNNADEVHFCKFHWISQQGIRNLTFDQAVRLAGEDPNYSIRDLYNAIATEDYPKWTLYIQVVRANESSKIPGVFDPVQIWDEEKYPLHPVGVMELNRNPEHYFSEVEQVAFDPGNLVPGIEMSPDRLLHGRSFSYSDTQRYRLGGNFLQLPINAPKNVRLNRLQTYMQDGAACLRGSSGPNYFPNSFGGPGVSVTHHDAVGPPEFIQGKAERTDSGPVGDNFSQAAKFYERLTPAEKERLIENTIKTLKLACKSVQERTLSEVFAKVSHDLYRKLKIGLRLEDKSFEQLSSDKDPELLIRID